MLGSVESWVRIQNITGYVSIADRRTLVQFPYDRTIAEDRTWFYLLCFYMIAELFAIHDHRYGNQLLTSVETL